MCWKNWKTDPIFDYDIKHGGAVHRGKWVGYKVRELEKKYNYKLDYGKREVVEDWMKDEKPTLLPKWKRIRSILKNRLTPCMEVCYGLLLRYKPD